MRWMDARAPSLQEALASSVLAICLIGADDSSVFFQPLPAVYQENAQPHMAFYPVSLACTFKHM